ncbi:unnamed protein product [Dibothriocephalus latus]|uniref:Citrate transporter-like domain-containing protein n=1 Tax=Dibothriocephalus latus TaxID=60516 RepID=A0A3P6QAG3_DIBLA|nr:unnamed protein product [Dibothriocephalus latus]
MGSSCSNSCCFSFSFHQVGGLSRVITNALQSVKSVSPFGLVCIITILGASITEIVSNSATVTILVPIMFDLAKSINVHPFLLSLPLTIATSLAFMLPAATAPNAIVYSKGRVKLVDMVIPKLFTLIAHSCHLNVSIWSIVAVFASV